MKERKFKEEYRLETQLDVRTGKPKQIPIYMGDYYTLDAQVTKKALAIACLPWLAGYIACYAVYMLMSSPSSYCIYVLPFACCATIPLLYAVIGAVNALRAPQRMTRVQKETGIARLLRSFIGCGVFVTLAVLGDLVFMLRNGFEGELLAALLLLNASIAAWKGFACAKRLHDGMTIQPGKAAQAAKEGDEQA